MMEIRKRRFLHPAGIFFCCKAARGIVDITLARSFIEYMRRLPGPSTDIFSAAGAK